MSLIVIKNLDYQGVKMGNLKSVSDLMVILGCQRITVYRLVGANKIPHKRIGRLIRFSDDYIQNYLESIRVQKEEGKNG